MKSSLFNLLIFLQFMFILAQVTYKPGEMSLELSRVEILKNNSYLSGTTHQIDDHVTVSDLQVLKEIGVGDGLTVSYIVIISGDILEASGNNIPFCLDDTSSNFNGLIVKILRLALGIQPEGCPIPVGPLSPLGSQQITVSGSEVLEKQFDPQAITIDLIAPGYDSIARVQAVL